MAKSQVRLDQALTEYQQHLRARGRSASTLKIDSMVVNKLIRHHGNLLVSSITPDHVDRFFYGPGGQMSEHKSIGNGITKREGIGPVTHNIYRSRLSRFFLFCYEQGWTRKNNHMHKIPVLKAQKALRQRPAPHVLLEMLEHCENGRDRCYIAVAINSGLRSSEIRRIRVGDVDLDSGYIAVTIQKTKESDEIPISSDLDAELRRWLTEYGNALGRPLTVDDYLFPTRHGGIISHYETDEDGQRRPVRSAFVWVPSKHLVNTQTVVQHALEALGLPTFKEGTHTIRRAVALAYFDHVAQEQGDVAALRETAALLHHQSVSTTERYLGMTAEKARRDRRLRGNAFLTGMVKKDNVVPFRPVAQGE